MQLMTILQGSAFLLWATSPSNAHLTHVANVRAPASPYYLLWPAVGESRKLAVWILQIPLDVLRNPTLHLVT